MNKEDVLKLNADFCEDSERTLIFFADAFLRETKGSATSFQSFQDKLKVFREGVLITNQTSSLCFSMFDYFDLIIIINTSKKSLLFKLNKDGIRIDTNLDQDKELRREHNLQKLWIAKFQHL